MYCIVCTVAKWHGWPSVWPWLELVLFSRLKGKVLIAHWNYYLYSIKWHCWKNLLYFSSRTDPQLYRIVGFELDTSSYSGDSILVTSKDNPEGVPVTKLTDHEKITGAKCQTIEKSSVLQIEADSELLRDN